MINFTCAIADRVHRFNTAQASSRGIERLESDYLYGNALDIFTVWLDYVILILASFVIRFLLKAIPAL
ncbi:hypothetical protein C7B79_19285 [Chroococcidiopsis cubana CCALA 043]|nr:hypothetical protein C7B80_10815 [Cyanosarcina cf. burmensis CCALA 770]PSB62144.1 hypothetical protein C7B79_19285 [Chroococcidiopsis cubana CCALA 043]